MNELRNPDRPSTMPLVNVPEQNDHTERKRGQRMSSPEKWEWKQMAAANVIDVSELPDFDEETGVLPKDDDSGMFLVKLFIANHHLGWIKIGIVYMGKY
jgi:hypothetical protein